MIAYSNAKGEALERVYLGKQRLPILSHQPNKVVAQLPDDVAVDRTVDYAGLEKATNQKAGDVRSDIYFLGTVLFECVTGEPIMPVTKDRQARMMARRYQEVEATLQKTGPALGVSPPLMRNDVGAPVGSTPFFFAQKRE